MAVVTCALVSQITAVSTCLSVLSSRRVKPTSVVSFGIQKESHSCDYGCSSSRFFASETPFSIVAVKTADKRGSLTVYVQASNYKQNKDLPPSFVSKRVKKPFVKPIQHGSHQKRMRSRELRQLPSKPLKAPANGMLVEKLIPLAHSVYNAYLVVLDGVSRLMKHLPVKACRWCSEVHVARVGHEIKTCLGRNSSGRNGEHLWVPGYLDDVVVPLEAFHLVDRLQKPISHEDRFNHDRIPAIVELCIQAGLDLPEFPTLRRTIPIDSSVSWPKVDGGEEHASASGIDDRNKTETIDDETKTLTSSGDEEERQSLATDETMTLSSSGDEKERQSLATDQLKRPIDAKGESGRYGIGILTISDDDDLKTVAEKTLRAWDQMRAGAAKLMATYPVRACGYCPEVHIGRRGHKLQLCGAFKHQWRNGQHGWQEASFEDLIPSRFVWHVRDKDGPPLKNKLAKYYGKAPAVVELCVQAGADVPYKYQPFMRLDVIIPNDDELDMVA